MNSPIALRHVRRLSFGAALMLMSVMILFMHSARALADATDGYDYEYVRTDVPTSGIQRGQKLGTIYLKQQTLTVWRNVDVTSSAPPIDTYAYSGIEGMGGGRARLYTFGY